jgi:transcriptional regulator EpsA
MQLDREIDQAPIGPGSDSYSDAPGYAGSAMAAAPLAMPGALELEAISLNLEASMRIYNDRHLFAWTQGMLQGLLRHEVLICMLRKAEDDSFATSSYSTDTVGPEPFDQLCRREAGFADAMIAAWQEQRYQAVMRDIDVAALTPDNHLQQELLRLGANRVIGHGTYDAGGRTESFYMFASRPEDAGSEQLRLVEMLVPFLHSACIRTRINLVAEQAETGSQGSGKELLTQREQEVLKWMYLGKSNIEIGMLLGISPLTVKNHVQEILRRLDVQNRAQAVGKAFKLHILSC